MSRRLYITGHLTAEPETKVTKNGKEYVRFRMGNNEPNEKDSQGNKVTFWTNVTVWDPTLMNFCKFLKKGSAVCVVGDYSNNVYATKSGTNEVSNEITARIIDFWGVKNDNDNNQSSSNQTQTNAVSNPDNTINTEVKSQNVQAEKSMTEDNDDLPF